MASNHNKEANMSVMNHHFAGFGFEGLLNVNTMIIIKRVCKDPWSKTVVTYCGSLLH